MPEKIPHADTKIKDILRLFPFISTAPHPLGCSRKQQQELGSPSHLAFTLPFVMANCSTAQLQEIVSVFLFNTGTLKTEAKNMVEPKQAPGAEQKRQNIAFGSALR